MNLEDEIYFDKLLEGWEETYKKGQLTFWILLSLYDGPLYPDEIKAKIAGISEGSIMCEEQSLYRALRKFYDAEIVNFELREGNKGPNRKYYCLSGMGRRLLETFVSRNIKPLHTNNIINLIKLLK